LAGTWINEATMEISMEIYKKTKIKVQYYPAISVFGAYLNDCKSIHNRDNPHTHVYNSNIL
jgi:hypothetical protein